MVGATVMLLGATVLVPTETVGELWFGFVVVALRDVELMVVDIAAVVTPAPASPVNPGQAVTAALMSSGTEAHTLW